jgi:hypothetical protein
MKRTHTGLDKTLSILRELINYLPKDIKRIIWNYVWDQKFLEKQIIRKLVSQLNLEIRAHTVIRCSHFASIIQSESGSKGRLTRTRNCGNVWCEGIIGTQWHWHVMNDMSVDELIQIYKDRRAIMDKRNLVWQVIHKELKEVHPTPWPKSNYYRAISFRLLHKNKKWQFWEILQSIDELLGLTPYSIYSP